jgi:hypothetical protein
MDKGIAEEIIFSSKIESIAEEILEYFPSKPLKCMMNYYCNPRYMSIETRSPFDYESK